MNKEQLKCDHPEFVQTAVVALEPVMHPHREVPLTHPGVVCAVCGASYDEIRQRQCDIHSWVEIEGERYCELCGAKDD